jgi:hypothetical protein
MALASALVERRALGGDPALAEQLFRQAKALAAQGRQAEACAKFYESQRQDPGAGTLLAVAQCHDAEGKIATAWAEYIEVRAASEGRRPDRVKLAELAISKLEPRLPKLTVRLSSDASALPGLMVALDGTALGAAALGADLPVDPGEHVVTAVATGRRWTTQVHLEEREQRTVTVPSLDPVAPQGTSVAGAAAASFGASVTPPAPGPSWRTVTGIAVGGAGVVSLGIGAFYGVHAASAWGDFKKLCSPPVCADSNARGPYDDARRAATLSNVFFGLGATAVAAGAVLVLLGRRGPGSAQIGAGAVSRTGGSVYFRTAW